MLTAMTMALELALVEALFALQHRPTKPFLRWPYWTEERCKSCGEISQVQSGQIP